jgi:hypothetical protein
MQPYLPTSAIKDLSVEVFGGDAMPRSYVDNDPDRFHASQSLEPDPVFMGLRALFTSGPIGRLRAWIDQKIEDREDRIYGNSGTEIYTYPVDRPGGVVVEEPRERDIAA